VDTLRVALIGYGTGGSVFHAPLIAAAEELSLAAVVTTDPGRRADVRQRYPGTELLDSPDEVWRPDRFDLVVVTTPNRYHVPLAQAAQAAGIPVVVDKPVAADAAAARTLTESESLVIPFHNRRWDGDFRTVRRLIADGALGTVLRFESRFVRWRPQTKTGWKESADPADAGGVLHDLGTHLIDQAIRFFGAPTEVYREVDVRRRGAVAGDDAFVALSHPGGVRSHLWMSAISADLGPRFRVLGDRAAYVSSPAMDVQEEQLRSGMSPLDPAFGLAEPDTYGRLGNPDSWQIVPTDRGAYTEFYPAVAEAIRSKTPPPVSLADAIATLEVIDGRSAV
jgi:predicted dehydrogenase